jgi:hypothetical protein
MRNRTAPRADKNKILPHGIPELIQKKPHLYNATDFKVSVFQPVGALAHLKGQIPVPADLIDEVEQRYAPPDHPVFQLVPPTFEERVIVRYNALDRPAVTINSFWNIYHQLLAAFRTQEPDPELDSILSVHDTSCEAIEADGVPLLPGQKDLRVGVNVVGAAGQMYYYSGGASSLPSGWTIANEGSSNGPEYGDLTDSSDSE